MFAKLLAWPAIILGVIWAVKPEILRNGLTRKTNWKLSWLTLITLFFPMIRIGRTAGILGIFVIFFIFWAAMTKAHAAVKAVFLAAPLLCYQALGVLNIVGGILILRI